MDRDLEKELEAIVGRFLRRWGNTGWRALIERVGETGDQRVVLALMAAAAIELDADFMRYKLRAAGLLRHSAIREYSDVWLSEEVDHGRCFEELALRIGGPSALPVRADGRALKRDRRALLAIALLWCVRPFRLTVLAGYFVRGCLVEREAIIIYRWLSKELSDAGLPDGALIVSRIAAQEGRHLVAFESGAQAVLRRGSRPMLAVVRWATKATFRPPGVDLFGRERWLELMAPLLDEPEVVTALAGIDCRLADLPGFADTHIVSDWLQGAGIALDVRGHHVR